MTRIDKPTQPATQLARKSNGHFLPGTTPNPGGRPAIVTRMRELAQEQTEAALKTLVGCLADEDGRVRVAAAVALLDRGYGRPAQSVQVDTDGATLMAGLVILPAMDPDA